MTRFIRRPPPDPEPEKYEEVVEHEEVTAEEDEQEERGFPKTLAKIQAREDNKFTDAFAIGLALLAEIGPPGRDGARNGSGDRFDECVEWLAEQGYDEYSPRTLKNWRDMAHRISASLRQEAEDAGVSVSVCQLCDPDTLKALMDAQAGKRPNKLTGLKTTYQGQEMPLTSAIRKRGRILVSDARIALGHPHAVDRSTASDTNGSTATDLTDEEWVEKTQEVMTTRPDLAVKVVAPRKIRSAVRRAVNEAEHADSLPSDPERVKENENISGPAGTGLAVATASEVIEHVDGLDTGMQRLQEDIESHHNVLDPDLVETLDLLLDKVDGLPMRADLLRAAMRKGFGDEDIHQFMKGDDE